MTTDEILRLTQKYIEEKPVTILGSGASVAFGLPTMHDLAVDTVNYLSSEPELSGALNLFNRTYEDTRNLERTLGQLELSAGDDIIRSIRTSIYESISRCDAAALEKILKQEIILPHSKLFKHFLRATPCSIDVITTNYDCLAEYGLNSIGARYDDLFDLGLLTDFSPRTNHVNYRRNSGMIAFLHKVHGSINWFVDDSKHLYSIPLRDTASKVFQPMIITHGTTKFRTTWDSPYRTIIQNADNAINNATCFLCIGYGFNDEHIQNSVISQIKNKKPIIVVVKKMTDSGNVLFSTTDIAKYLIFEECTGGTTVKGSELMGPQTINGLNLWSFSGFTDWLID